MSLQPLSRTYSLSRRFTISLVLMVALIALGATIAFYVDANRQTENELLARADGLIAHLAGVAAIPLWDLNTQAVTAIGDTLARDAMVAGIVITDRFGDTLYSYQNSQYPIWLERTHQIQHKGQIIGDARVMFTKQRGQKAQRELLRALIITTTTMLLALTFATGALVRIFLRHPLQRLNAIVNAYAAGTYNMEDVFLPYLEFQPFAHVLQRMGTTISEQMTRLQENEERYRKAQAMGHVGNWEYNLQTEHFWGSDEAKRMYGFEPAQPDFSTDAVENCIPDRARVHQALLDLIENEKPYHLEFEIHPNDLSPPRIIASIAELQRDQQGKPLKVVGLIQDITERKRAEEALRESEERFRFVLNNSLDAAYRRNLQTDRYDYMSPVIEHVLGWSVAEMNEMSTDTVLRLIHPDDVPGIAQELERTTAECRATGRATGKLEYRLRDKQGVYRWVDDTITVLADANGSPLYRLGMVRDIAERKLSEEKLLQYQRIVSSTPDGIALLDRRYRYIIVNDSYERFSGVSRDAFIGKTVAEYLGEEVFQRQVKIYFDRCLQGETIRYRSWFAYPTLGLRFVEVTYSPYCNPRQEIIGIVSNTRDITESKQAEDALRESEARLKIAIRHSSFVFAFCDCELRYTWIHNPHSDFKPEEVIGKRDDELAENEGTTRLVRFKQRVIDTGSGSREEISFPLSQGSRTYDMIAEPLRDDAGHVIGVATAALDVTERKQAEVQIREHNRLLEEAVQQKQREMEALFERMLRQEKLATIGQITGSIAHELRNPLGAVKQAIYYLKKLAQRQQLTADNPKVLRHLDIMETELNTSERVIADLLEITRMKHPKRQPTDMRTLLADAIARCHLPPDVRVTISLTPAPIEIFVDPLQLRQVFLNVLTNAAQAIEGSGAISIDATQSPESGETLIEIADTGVGLTSEALQKVFEPLYTTKATGTGLGLPICKEIIESHSGQISLASDYGQGTTVTIVLPRNDT